MLLGDERYEANYALSTLRMQLRKESEEILERRWDAWSRLLAIFRAVFGGIEHEHFPHSEQDDVLVRMVPVQRAGKPEEVAALVAFLAGPDAGYITGETLHVNGGMYMA